MTAIDRKPAQSTLFQAGEAERAEDRLAGGTIWYMGAKTRLLGPLRLAIEPLLARAAARAAQAAPVLADVFAGTGVVAAHFAEEARVLANDAQRCAAVTARALLQPAPCAEERLAATIARAREEARRVLAPFSDAAAEEARFLGASPRAADLAAYRDFLERHEAARPDPEREAADLRARGLRHCLLTAYYRNIYFGIAQAAALDGLRAAIDETSEPERTLYLAALLFVASHATSATAHFAQPRPLHKDTEVRALLGRRRIDAIALFEARALWLAQCAARRRFAGDNRVYALPYEAFFEAARGERIDVVYADPPYTRDQYSRFYHVLETIVDYDYPPLARDARGAPVAGRYPEIGRRFQSRFANPSTVEDEFRRVTGLAAARGAALVWSYSSTNGILFKRWGGAIEPFRALLRERYRTVHIREYPLLHSGAGDKKHAANEIIAVCEDPCA